MTDRANTKLSQNPKAKRNINMRSAISVTGLLLLLTPAVLIHAEEDEVSYGVDVSFPIHRETVSNNYAWLPHNMDPENNPTPRKYRGMPVQPLGDKQAFYDNFIKGCEKKYSKGPCRSTERDRVAMSLRQPQAMTNYTEVGYKKIKTPPEVWALIKSFWEKNKEKQMPENWPRGNTYTNHWDAPTFMVSVEDKRLRGGGHILKEAIWEAARDTIQEWTGQELTQCSLYGIRVYTEGAVLATHVDRMPLVSSAIVNVDQDVDEPWPLEVIAHDGTAHNVTMEPGDMVLYESHSVLHGRPFPLKGRYYANIFIHFEPTGHTLRHHNKANSDTEGVHEKYKKSVDNRQGGHEQHEMGMPDYIKEGTDEADRWRMRHPDNKRSAKIRSFQTGSTVAHKAAKEGDVEVLEEIVEALEDYVHLRDQNGWTPLHEGARSGHHDIVQFLVEKGANINEKTNGGETPLYWAEKEHGHDHIVVRFLRGVGAISLGPDL